ncbi:unnamed protein product [Strongylus vulgaris]|uniref:Secreted protein n=1 Tax=Strongylus vulgaris TaxID=40348 RepID=A0A3P7J210_STRVU|nr:unnamed protein product [Strongylus vulgaris]
MAARLNINRFHWFCFLLWQCALFYCCQQIFPKQSFAIKRAHPLVHEVSGPTMPCCEVQRTMSIHACVSVMAEKQSWFSS